MFDTDSQKQKKYYAWVIPSGYKIKILAFVEGIYQFFNEKFK